MVVHQTKVEPLKVAELKLLLQKHHLPIKEKRRKVMPDTYSAIVTT